jgi:beta-glucosidase
MEMNTSLFPDERANLLLAQMTLEEKIEMVHGELPAPYGFYNAPIPRLGIPALTMADGPAGIRVARRDVNEGKATALPAPIGLAATWDLKAAKQYGDLLGHEAWATGHNVVLGPELDIARVPAFGRLFEAAHSTVEAANAGLDQEMPNGIFFSDRLMEAIQMGQVSVTTLDDKVHRILRTMFALGLFDQLVQITPFPVQEHGKLAREIAGKGIVLLKNADGLLPLASHELRSVAVIGADADNNIAGGGSSVVQPTYFVSILEGIRRRAGEGVRVEYAEGTDPVSAAALLPGPPPVPSSVLTPTDSGSEVQGLHAEYWTNTRFEGEPTLVRIDRQVDLNLGFFNYSIFNASSLTTPPELTNAISVRWTGGITVPTTGNYTLSLTHLGTARLYLDGQLLIEDPGITLETRSVTMHLVAGQPHALRIEYAADRPEQHTPLPGEASTSGMIGSKVRLGWQHPADAIPSAMQEAAVLARLSDVAVVVVRDYRNEHADLPSLTLSNEQDLLIQVVAAANPRTIVALATGGLALMPWLDQVPAVLESWYGGQEQGNALADILFGDVTPSGKLPVTFPRSDHGTPVSSPEQYAGRDGFVAHYSEGLAVGYRGYDQFWIEPLFPFGYGLSYTGFAYAQLQVEPETTDGTRNVQLSFTVTNTGGCVGAEIAQVYLGLPASTGEPLKRLVGWAKVELAPGETEEITVTLDPNATSHPLSYWNVNTHGWETASGDYQVYVGASSRDIRLTGTLRVHRAERYHPN